MKLQWLGDIKDVFKFGVCLTVMKCLELEELLWVMMLTDNEKKDPYDALPCVPKDLRTFLYKSRYKQITEKELDKFKNQLEKQIKKEYSPRACITLVKDRFDKETNRTNYFNKVKNKMDSKKRMLVLIDPDTGFEPKKVNHEHVKYEEVKEVFETMNDQSVLAVFQTMRREGYEKTACNIINYDKFEANFNKNKCLCIYARKAHALIFLFFKNDKFKSKMIEYIKSIKCLKYISAEECS